MNAIRLVVGWLCFVLVAVVGFLWLTDKPDTDARPALDDRTPLAQLRGFYIIDPDTGCHYMTTLQGGVTPRLTADGKQLCLR